LSRIGSWGAVWLALALALALFRKRIQPFVLVLLADAASDGAAELLKSAVGETRPHLPHPLVAVPHSKSFPSGHAATSFACATVLAVLLPRAAPLLYVLAFAIAYSRLYVGVHWPLDVVAGGLIGILTALLLLSEVRRRSRGGKRSG
jgi:undecaprenyl-diphosphatase